MRDVVRAGVVLAASELAPAVAPPAVDRAAGHQRARVLVPARDAADGACRQPRDLSRRSGEAVEASVGQRADLTADEVARLARAARRVRSPAPDAVVDEEGAS